MAFGWDDAAMMALAGSNALGGAKGGDGQEMSSFDTAEGRRMGIDPYTVAGEAKGMLGDTLNAFIDQANSPITLGESTTVAPLPVFAGGGLPMAIGAPARDPGRQNPANRTLESSVSIPRRSLAGVDPNAPRRGDTGRTAEPRAIAAPDADIAQFANPNNPAPYNPAMPYNVYDRPANGGMPRRSLKKAGTAPTNTGINGGASYLPGEMSSNPDQAMGAAKLFLSQIKGAAA